METVQLIQLISSLTFLFIVSIILLRRRFNKKKLLQRPPRRGINRSLTYVHQYPCGWYRICNSTDVEKRGDVKHVTALGREMVVYRSDDEHQTVHVLEAFCVHMGANLAVGGKVAPGTNCIQCPFHLWEFDGQTGRCTKIPYINGKIPDTAKMFSYPCVERYGMVMIWYHPLNEEPHYDAITVDDLSTNEFVFRGNYSYPNIRMHLQEFCENAADVQHFQPLHGQMMIPWTEYQIPLLEVHHEAGLEFEAESHLLRFRDTAMLRIFGKNYPESKAHASILFYGPGGITLFRFDGDFGRIYLFHTHTPTSFTELDVEFFAFVEKKVWRILSWYIIGNWIAQWKRDIFVWENKIFQRSPCLVKNDGPLMKVRRWYSQFLLSREDYEIHKQTLDW